MNLTAEQQAAVDADARSILVEAGPGAGKTTVLVVRALRLIADHVRPERIRVFVFTRAAAEEIRARLAAASRLGGLVDVTTFHAFALRVVQASRAAADLSPLEVASRLEERAFTDRIYDPRSGDRLPPRDRPTRTMLKEQITAYAAQPHRQIPDVVDTLRFRMEEARLAPAWSLVRAALEADLPGITEDLPEAEHVLIDESQDCTAADVALATTVRAGRAARFAVGDPRQSIMEWRLAGPHHVEAEFGPGAARLALSRSQRFGSAIAATANRIAAAFGGASVTPREFLPEFCAVRRAGSLLEALAGTGHEARDTAVLCRTNEECRDAFYALGGDGRAVLVSARDSARGAEDEDAFATARITNRIAVATMHAAKGKEWGHVVVAPSRFFPDGTPEDLRVLYVAATRAVTTLSLCPLSRHGEAVL